jgi:arylsulfatase A-like enzyme
MDLLPTFAALAGAELPRRPLDGHDIRHLIFDPTRVDSPWDSKGFCYYRLEQMQAVRAGPWKLYLPLEAKFISNARKLGPAPLELYDVRKDVAEAREVSAENPEVVARLRQLAEAASLEIEAGQRPAGWVEPARPLVKE